jgi:putative peptidoglycan lipid II flippase
MNDALGPASTRLSQYLVTVGLLVVGMTVSVVGQALIAFYFGTGTESDALFMARDAGDLATKLLIPAQAAGVLLPLFVQLRRRQSDAAGWHAAGAILSLVAMASIPLVVLALVAAPLIVDVLAPGFDAETKEAAVPLVRIMAPYIFCIILSTIAAALLQAQQRFGRAMSASALSPLAMVVTLPLLVPAIGIEGAAWAIVAAAAVQLLVVWGLLLRDGLPLWVSPFAERDAVRDFVSRAARFYSFAIAGQVSGVAFRIAVSTAGKGAYAALGLALRLQRALVSLLLMPVQYVLLPALAHSEAQGSRDEADRELVATLRQVVYMVAPVVLVLVVLSGPVTSLVYERGSFSAEDRDTTALTLLALCVAILPTGLHMLLEQAAYARQRTRLVVRTNVAVELTQGALYFPTVALFGVPGIAVAFFAATGLAAVVYGWALRPVRRSDVGGHVRFLVATAAACASLAAVTAVARAGLEAAFDPAPGIAQAVIVVPSALAGFATYLLASWLLRIREPLALARSLRELAARRSRGSD